MPKLSHRQKIFPAVNVAVVDAREAHGLVGVLAASDTGLMNPILIGQRKAIQEQCLELGCDADRILLLMQVQKSGQLKPACPFTRLAQVLPVKQTSTVRILED